MHKKLFAVAVALCPSVYVFASATPASLHHPAVSPDQDNGMVHRSALTSQLESVLQPPPQQEQHSVVVLVTGPAKSGKTTLVRDCISGFPRGAVFLPVPVAGSLLGALQAVQSARWQTDVDGSFPHKIARWLERRKQYTSAADATQALMRRMRDANPDRPVLVVDVEAPVSSSVESAEAGRQEVNELVRACVQQQVSVVVVTRDPSLVSSATHELVVGDLTQDEAYELVSRLSGRPHDDHDDHLPSRHAGDLVELYSDAFKGDEGLLVNDRLQRLRLTMPSMDVVEMLEDGRATAPAVRWCRVLQALSGPPRDDVVVGSLSDMLRMHGFARLHELIGAAGATEAVAIDDVQRLLNQGIVGLAALDLRAVDDDTDAKRSDPVIQLQPAMSRAYHALRSDPDVEKRLDRLLLSVQLHNSMLELKTTEIRLDDEAEALKQRRLYLEASKPAPTDDEKTRSAYHEALLFLHEGEMALQFRRDVLQRQFQQLDLWRVESQRPDRQPNIGI